MKKKPLPMQSFLYLVKHKSGYRFSDQPNDQAVIVFEFVRPEAMVRHFNIAFKHRLKDDGVLMLTADDLKSIRNGHRAQLVEVAA